MKAKSFKNWNGLDIDYEIADENIVMAEAEEYAARL